MSVRSWNRVTQIDWHRHQERGKMELRNSYLKSSEQHSFFKMEGFSYCIKNFRCVTSLFFKRAKKSNSRRAIKWSNHHRVRINIEWFFIHSHTNIFSCTIGKYNKYISAAWKEIEEEKRDGEKEIINKKKLLFFGLFHIFVRLHSSARDSSSEEIKKVS